MNLSESAEDVEVEQVIEKIVQKVDINPPSLIIQTNSANSELSAAFHNPSSAIPDEVSQAKASVAKELLKSKMMEHFVISYTVSNGKVTKLQVNGAQGGLVMEINLKKWEEKA